MNKNRGQYTQDFHFGRVRVEVKPRNEYADQLLAIDAMAHAIGSPLSGWALINTVDPQTKGGQQEQFTLVARDGQREIADVVIDVPTSSNYGTSMFALVAEKPLKAGVKAFKALETPGSDQRISPPQPSQTELTKIVSGVMEETSKVDPEKVRRQQTR
jgi:hypothetical protein